MKRKWWVAALVLAALAVALPFFPVNLLRAPIQRALERGLGRKVEIGAVHFTLFPSWTPAPGFTLDDVTIHEDPRAGIEPFAYVDSLGASVRLLGLFKRKLEFSSLNLGGQEVNINLVKTAAGPWNFQYLLGGPALSISPSVRAIPALRMRGGRVNFKFGDTKSVFFFDNADLDVAPGADGSVELRFGGAPARTDHSAQDFGRLFVNGRSSAGNRALDFKVELERSSLEEILRLFDPSGFGIQGSIALEAQLSGAPSQLNVSGQIQVGDVHRWDLLPTPATALRMPFNGALDLRTERLELSTSAPPAAGSTAGPASEVAPQSPVTVRLNVRELLSAPDWDAAADLTAVPVAPLIEIARRMGVALPQKLAVDGTVSGSLGYARENGFSGHIGLERASITLPEAAPLAADAVVFDIGSESGASTVRMQPATLRVGENRSVDVEGSAALGIGHSGARALDLKITTRGISVADMRSFGFGAIPLLEHATQGTWRGWARFRAGDSAGRAASQAGGERSADPQRGADPLGTRAGEWTGESELLDARIPVEGLADPVQIKSAAISLNGSLHGQRAAITRLRAKVGDVSFTGDYRWEQGAARPHRFRLAIAEADAAELQRLLEPALVRQRGFLARTLGLRAAALPEWLAARHAEGTISIDTLAAGDTKIRGLWTRMVWDAGMVYLLGLNARMAFARADSPRLDAARPETARADTIRSDARPDAARPDTARPDSVRMDTGGSAVPGTVAGDLTIDLSASAPQFHFEGEVKDVAWRGGRIDLEGVLDAEGSGLQLLETARAEGRLRGRGIAFAPEADFRAIAGDFQVGPGPARWKLSNLEVAVGPETFTGSGVSQADGRIVLDLANRARQVHYAGTFLAAGTAP